MDGSFCRPVSIPMMRSSFLIIPSLSSFFIPAGDAPDAISQSNPLRPTTDMPSSISESLTVVTTPLVYSKALMELYEWGWIKKIPRIAVINAEGARTLDVLYNREDEPLRWNKGRPNEDAIVEYYDKLDKTGSRPNTKATAIQIGRPANIIKALRALEYTNGVVTTVSDSEMLDGMSVVGLNGFDCEMASGASPAGIKKLLNEGIIKKDDRIIGILTGRQKDPSMPVNYHTDSSNEFARPPRV